VGTAVIWCERRDSNSHGLPHWNLNPARLPIPPHSQENDYTNKLSRRKQRDNLDEVILDDEEVFLLFPLYI
jgi:hypothetical protein